ncbi:MAG: diguanylate cyclase [Nitrospirota bacterium]|nr:diguanylate cyclase [Nitrospirota bacterium]MDP2383788.1 diguanylate cyclase [Nitrospirota bacterium]
MSRKASSDHADPISVRAITPAKEEDRRPCLFVVGHAAFQRKSVWTGLEALGNRVRRFTRPAALLAAIDATSPDAIFCEVTAAPEPAFELLNRLAAVQCDACVIFMGPDLGAEQVARCLRDGAFDYLTVPSPDTRVLDTLQKGLINRQAFQAVRDLSGQLAQVNASLAGERDVLRQWNIKLSLLNHLTQALAGPLNSESIARSLFNGLAGLVPVDVIGLGRPDPHRVWTWSRTAAYEAQEQRVRAHLLSRFNAQATPVCQTQAQVLQWSSGLPASERPAQMTIPLAFSPNSQGLLYVERQQGIFSESELQLLSMVGTSLSLALHNAAIHQQMQELASRDGLTGLLNRRALEDVLSRELKAGMRYRASACLILVDVDHFKQVNDLFGHLGGDQVLTEMATVMQDAVRDTDSVGRYGGEEFGIVLPHTDLARAAVLAERLRDQIEQHTFDVDGGSVRITVSVGIAQIPDKTIGTVPEWMAAADAALYESKNRGRNRVVIHTTDNCACA